MKVYFSSSLWEKGKGLCGRGQRINWQFEYRDSKQCIPVLYRFPKGIVFDVITILDEGKLQDFFNKYRDTEEALTPLQRLSAEQEHPYQALPIKEIWINGKCVENSYSSSSSLSIPWARQEDNLTIIRQAYSNIINDLTSFGCQRFCVPYPKTDSKVENLLRSFRINKVHSFKITTMPVQLFIPIDIHFEILDKEEKKVSFMHPKTGITHTLYFQKRELVELPIDKEGNKHIYSVEALYEIDPSLPKGDSLQFNTSVQYTKPPGAKFGPVAASSVGIIGGAYRPTTIFNNTENTYEVVPRGLRGLPLNRSFSIPSFNKKDAFYFVLEGINTKVCDSKKYSL